MTKPRGRRSGMNHTVSLTDGEWERIRAWAGERGKSASAWFCECALSVDPFPETAPVRPLVLDAEQQRGLARNAAAAAGDMRSEGGEASSNLAHDMRALLELRLGAMAREGRREQAVDLLRRVLGDERAAVVAAAVLPDVEEAAKPPKPRKAPAGSAEGPDLFTVGAGGPAGGA